MKCKLCNSGSTYLYLQPMQPTVNKYYRGRFKTKDKKYTHYKCNKCKSIFIDPLPTKSDLDKVYTKGYYFCWEKDYNKNMTVRYINEHQKFKLFSKKIKLKGSNRRILDIGCALGHFLYWAEPYFSELHGVEYPDYAINFLKTNKVKSKKKIKVAKRFIGRYPSNYFDVVCAWELLEHIPNPKEYITEIRRVLKPGGKIIASVPNSLSITLSIFKEEWEDIMPPNHIYIFSKKFLKIFFENCSFKSVDISCGSKTELFPPLGIYALIAKIFGFSIPKRLVDESTSFRKQEPISHVKKLIYAFYYKIALIISLPINLSGYGDSLLLVATKTEKFK